MPNIGITKTTGITTGGRNTIQAIGFRMAGGAMIGVKTETETKARARVKTVAMDGAMMIEDEHSVMTTAKSE
jgi:hypothetical protein